MQCKDAYIGENIKTQQCLVELMHPLGIRDAVGGAKPRFSDRGVVSETFQNLSTYFTCLSFSLHTYPHPTVFSVLFILAQGLESRIKKK